MKLIEYQDTIAAQFRLVHALTLQHRNFCVVGDDDQSIYGWRGAEIANLLDLEKHYPEVKIIKLEQNYRSTQNILEAASAVVANNVKRIVGKPRPRRIVQVLEYRYIRRRGEAADVAAEHRIQK